MSKKTMLEMIKRLENKGQRVIAPLVGFPGLNLTGGSVKLAQQNYGVHYNVVESLAAEFEPDLIFPLMDLSVEANVIGWYTVFPQETPIENIHAFMRAGRGYEQ